MTQEYFGGKKKKNNPTPNVKMNETTPNVE